MARKAKDPLAAIRNRGSVDTMARRDKYPGNVMRVGVGDWLEFASAYQELLGGLDQDNLPEVSDLHKHTKSDALRYDDFEDKAPGGNAKKRSAHQAKLDELYQADVRGDNVNETALKIFPKIDQHNKIIVADRFGGELCWTLFDKSGKTWAEHQKDNMAQKADDNMAQKADDNNHDGGDTEQREGSGECEGPPEKKLHK